MSAKPNPIQAYMAAPFSSNPPQNTVRVLAWCQAVLAAGNNIREAYPSLWGGVVPVAPHIIGMSSTSIPTITMIAGKPSVSLVPGRLMLSTPPESWWYDATLALMLRCDLLIVAGYTAEERQASVGTVAEIAAAEDAGIPRIELDRGPTERRGPTHDDVVGLADEMTALWRAKRLPREG